DRNSASTAISNAIRRLKYWLCSPSCAFSMVSWISDIMAPLVATRAHFARHCEERKRRSNPERRLDCLAELVIGPATRWLGIMLGAWMRAAVSLDQALGIDGSINLRGG